MASGWSNPYLVYQHQLLNRMKKAIPSCLLAIVLLGVDAGVIAASQGTEQPVAIADFSQQSQSVATAPIAAPPSSATANDASSATPATVGTSQSTGAQAANSPASVTAIDLTTLEDRLVETEAIGFFTKLELKSQLDELTGKFRDFHGRSDVAQLTHLREDFDLLLLKLLILLQDDDPGLHKAVAEARPGIWRTFSDPALFAQL